MEKLGEWITSKFQHPLAPLFFLLGVMLLLLGLSSGVNLPVLNQLTADSKYRWVTVLAGVLSLITSIVIYYKPPKKPQSSDYPLPPDYSLPPDHKLNFSARRAAIGNVQNQLLTHITERVLMGKYISQDTLEKSFAIPKKELFYRLEHLRLLGFIERQQIGEADDGLPRYSYSLNEHYRKEFGDLTVFTQNIRITQQGGPVKSGSIVGLDIYGGEVQGSSSPHKEDKQKDTSPPTLS